MREQYPFFRDPEERARAVIGGEAADADLNGEYRKPYAILSDCRLYLKNERGNFIIERDKIKSAGKGVRPGMNWFAWAAAILMVLALALLCLCCWGPNGGYWRARDIDHQAQRYIDDYYTLEEKIPEYEQTVKDYEDTEEEIYQLQQKLEDMDHDKIMQDASKAFQEEDRLRAVLNEATAAKNDQQRLINSIENEIAGYHRDITETENKIKNVDTAKNNEVKAEIDILETRLANWRKWKNATDADFSRFGVGNSWTRPGWTYSVYYTYNFGGEIFHSTDQIRAYCEKGWQREQAELSDLQKKYIDIDGLYIQIDWDKHYIAESETYLAELQKQLDVLQEAVDTAKAEMDSYQPTVKDAREKANEVESLRANLAQKQSAFDGAALSNAQSNIQRFKDSESNYKKAQADQQKARLLLPCVLAFGGCAVILIVLTALKKTKAAAVLSLAAACVGLVCASLSDIHLDYVYSHDPYMPGYLTYSKWSWLSVALRALPVLAVLLGALALWWDKRRTVFRVVHTTGEFFFAPSLYPAEELKAFEAQVKGAQEAGPDRAAEAGTADGGEAGFLLSGSVCSAALTGETITMNGNYYHYDVHKRRKASGRVTVDLLNVMRVGFTKTYSRLMLLVPSAFGMLALLIKAFPAIELKKTFFEIEDVWDASVGVTLWSLPYQDELWKACAVLCVLTIPLYWLGYRNDLEVNTTGGRYLLPAKGMDKGRIAFFQQAFTRLKGERQKAKKNGE